MKLFANENLFEPIISYLRKKGHDVLSVREGFSGISDDEVYKRACKEKLVQWIKISQGYYDSHLRNALVSL